MFCRTDPWRANRYYLALLSAFFAAFAVGVVSLAT